MIQRDKINILIVDNQPQKLASYSSSLWELQENVISVSSRERAIEVLSQKDVDIVLIDVDWPALGGFAFAEQVLKQPHFRKPAILFICNSQLSDADRLRGYGLGAMDYIAAPVVPEILRAKIRIVVELRRKSRQLETVNNALEERVAERTAELEYRAYQVRDLNHQLQRRLAELESIMEVLPVGVSIAHDPAGKVITGNASLNHIFQVSQGKNLSLLAHTEAEPAVEIFANGSKIRSSELPVERACATGASVPSMEIEVRLQNGHKLQALASANPLFSESGQVVGAVGAWIDISRQKRLEQELKQRAELLEMASEAVIARDLHGVITFWNAGAMACYGWSSAEAVGKQLHELLQTRFPAPFEEIQGMLEQGGRWEGNLIQTRKDGQEITVACRKNLEVEGASGSPVILEVCRDITEQLQAEEALRRADKLSAMGKMAGIVAHEINNPLGAITNLFYLLRNHPSLNEEARRYAILAEEELSRVAHITKQTLAFYRDSAYILPVSLPALLDEILDIRQHDLAASNIRVEKRYVADLQVEALPGELKQVFLNLIANAIEAMPGGGRLRLHVYRSFHQVSGRPGTRVSILDTGTGIKIEDARQLFQPFFSTKAGKGTGLGLWVSRGIVQKYEGAIAFRSVSQAGGHATCFSVFLPAAPGLEETAEAGSSTVGEDPHLAGFSGTGEASTASTDYPLAATAAGAGTPQLEL